ncbi:MAG: hypothetical protein A3G33_02970 [Omnitrophica bacterium RIFCSPLOWO2_12_FULL_44_17]|uniref:Isoprenylcysteine carboxylmethyltransferase family protein n=1 Tax=Candidatus Danuiimicrobium aquiferis TaxID=1801832 RepID=A0A1G1KVM1_9BACT|nr:MAG: hypothetical protein A3B72_04450 [Omnitrophica bacterium RIFCSPHIGHO2_02_FULL_45_28]OGW90433.1 MAG: hypothetical protein A3E74_04265 [Omnitrophica bacterium RIFCSPHIGHO2_12_FULL_44_12]OGW96941.1 MAG: hypothetical protein A3G33_02970 [Omnitrophica bacterium RIFCSPLOWO2_12_FULL_44_17]OGX03923.1 MAG: hypothetical protein A3J12_03445 [Omnitrophica bacterium RIFCSPLOWO2_02_FULL_44_11]
MFEKAIGYLVRRSGKEFTPKYKTIATILGAILFIAGWPALLYGVGLLFPGEVFPAASGKYVIAALSFAVGIPWMLWAIWWQLSRGKGTPVPIVPTQTFLPSGPYQYVRNPMIVGHLFYLLGWAALFNYMGGFWFVLFFAVIMVLEIKLIEEKELEQRFGGAYRQYKKMTPFVIPRFRQ